MELELLEAVARYALERRHWDDPRKSFPALFYDPLPSQVAALKSHAPMVFHGGANRTGKTRSQAVNVALYVNGVKGLVYEGFPKECEPVHWWAVSKTYKQAQEVVVKQLKWALGKTLVRFDETKMIMYIWNGSTIGIKSEDSGFEVFQGADLDGVWKDEIGSRVVFGECRARLVDRAGKMLVSYTPTQGRDWSFAEYYRPWKEATNGEAKEHDGVLFVSSAMTENPYLPPSAIKEMERHCFSEQEKQIRLYGHYVDEAGIVFPNFNRRVHVIPPFEIPSHWPRFRGMDWGQRSPATCIWLAVDPDSGKHYVYREFYRKELTIGQIAAQVKAMSGVERYAITVLDPSCWNREPYKDAMGRDITKALIYQQNGLPVVKATNDLQIGIDHLKGLLGAQGEEPKFFIFEGAAPNLVREITDWPWSATVRGVEAVGQMGAVDKPDEKYDDHGIDACRYVVMAARLMVKADLTGFSSGDATGFEDESVGGTRPVIVPELVKTPDGSGHTYRFVHKRVNDGGFDEVGSDPSGGFGEGP